MHMKTPCPELKTPGLESSQAYDRLGQYCALLKVIDLIARHHDLRSLFHDMAQSLPWVITFDYLTLVLPDPARQVMRLHILESQTLGSEFPDLELPIAESPAGMVWTTQQPALFSAAEIIERFPRMQSVVEERGVKTMLILPLTTAQRRVGALGIGRTTEGEYSPDDLEFLKQVASQVAGAVDNALMSEQAQHYQNQLALQRDRLQVILEITNTLVANLDRQDLFAAISTTLRRVIHHDVLSLALLEPGKESLRVYALNFPGSQETKIVDLVESLETALPGRAILTRQPQVIRVSDLKAPVQSEMGRRIQAAGIKSACFFPLINRDRVLGTLNLGSRKEDAYSSTDMELLGYVANQVAIAVENAQAFRQIAELKDKLAEEKVYLEDEIRTSYNFEEIVGGSAALRRVLKQVEKVAPTESTVMILGETGTGKELIARALHHLSARRDATFVKLNCAAIPSGLLESELFGHERGAFTGAIQRKIGRIELADQGTLFLDEVGDLPLEIQPKLLRVLQEREFERLGSTQTLQVNMRLIAATNRDLAQMVAAREFRSDLFYRLNVFPIVIPPLRQRREDIPMLVRYFAQKYSRRMNKNIESVPMETMRTLAEYPWPGNIRELENFVERAVILSTGTTLQLPVGELKGGRQEIPSGVITLEAAERDHILRALNETNWVVGGATGAAARLGMKRTTLQSRLRKLGLSRLRPVAGS